MFWIHYIVLPIVIGLAFGNYFAISLIEERTDGIILSVFGLAAWLAFLYFFR